ncbi:MAG TPA: aspartate carbamoyltransferase catalytic subunit [Bacteroidota bacterium]|nr:aspartate carbamoyltransferase catalytic subunit [Bacteroidota bacterium]
MALSSRHLLGLDGMPKKDIEAILEAARSFKEILGRPIKKVPTLQGKTIVNLFFENSTRTRISFELAERRLSADVVNFSATGSSVSKGETLKDTARNIEAMKIDMVVIRHAAAGTPHFLTRVVKAAVLNAGDGCHEHPTQALLDMYTLKERFGSLEGLRVCIIGDITHSRVARSNIYGLRTMGASVSVCGPATLIPKEIERLGVTVYNRIDDVLPRIDALNVLRIQLERQAGGLFPSLREYHRFFGVTKERLDRVDHPITIMHPGPINRDVELSADVADGPHSVILDQVLNGVAVRMAVLYLLGATN